MLVMLACTSSVVAATPAAPAVRVAARAARAPVVNLAPLLPVGHHGVKVAQLSRHAPHLLLLRLVNAARLRLDHGPVLAVGPRAPPLAARHPRPARHRDLGLGQQVVHHKPAHAQPAHSHQQRHHLGQEQRGGQPERHAAKHKEPKPKHHDERQPEERHCKCAHRHCCANCYGCHGQAYDQRPNECCQSYQHSRWQRQHPHVLSIDCHLGGANGHTHAP
mmetsp:Transcript_476/g.1269  ORF Transcript_476/g.1269 Transcript_476/m.1269 type:complete len:219 (+) Transcript_476:567-1223(+)